MVMMILAEKPDVAKKISQTFHGKPKDGYYEISPSPTFPNGAYVGFAIGHLVEFYQPEDYDERYKTWRLEDLPIIPEKFRYKVSKGKGHALNTIKKLMNDSKVTEICIATDAGREGENIAYSIINLVLKKKKPIKRLWVSSMTPDAFRKGFNNLRDGSETITYYYEAHARAVADWLIGMNMTRSATIHLSKIGIRNQGVFSVGRVQTPVLKIIVDREREIENFVSEPFWNIHATFDMNEKIYEGKWFKEKNGETIDRFMEKEKAIQMKSWCENKPAKVDKIEKEQKIIKPPRLFSLSALQTRAGKIYKYSPSQTLDIAQKLYTNGYISYPRSDSDAITKEEAKQFPKIFGKLKQIDKYAIYFPTPIESSQLSSRFINPKRVSDHYAIIPTEQVPDISKLSKDEANIYDLIVRSVIAAHYPDAVFDHTSVITIVGEQETFSTKGKVLKKEGWRKVIFPNGQTDDEDESDDTKILPNLSVDEMGQTKKIEIKEGKTKPPNRFTQSNLINVMKYAGRYTDVELLDEEELENEMGKLSIGTEATRAGIIETLVQRNFIQIKNNKVYATEKGKILIDALGDKTILSSPILTAKWEKVLEQIGKGKFPADKFIEKGKQLTISSLNKMEESAKEWDFSNQIELLNGQKKIGKCPICGSDVVNKGKFYGCEGYQKNGCKFGINPKVLNKKISEAQIRKLLQHGRTDEIKGFVSKEGSKFNAYLYWNEEKKKITFGFKKTKVLEINCPFCNQMLVDRDNFIGCSGFKKGCRFTIPKSYLEKKLSHIDIQKLVTEGMTDLITGFEGKYGSFDGWLYLDRNQQKIKLKINKKSS